MRWLGESFFALRGRLSYLVPLTDNLASRQVQAGRIIEGEGEAEIGLVPENYLALLERDEALWQSEGEGEGEGDVEEIEVDEGVETGAIGLEKVDVIPESQLESPLNTTTLAIKEAPA